MINKTKWGEELKNQYPLKTFTNETKKEIIEVIENELRKQKQDIINKVEEYDLLEFNKTHKGMDNRTFIMLQGDILNKLKR